MVEIFAVLGIIAALLFIAYGAAIVKWSFLLVAGISVTALGLAAGIVTGSLYHIALHRALAPLGLLEKGWWWHPTRYNHLVPPERRRLVMPWFYAGAASMFVTLGGCLLAFVGIMGA